MNIKEKIIEMYIDGIIFPMLKNAEHEKQLIDLSYK